MTMYLNTFGIKAPFIWPVHLLMCKIQLLVMHFPAYSVTWCNSTVLISRSLEKNPSIILLCSLHMYMEAANEAQLLPGKKRKFAALLTLLK